MQSDWRALPGSLPRLLQGSPRLRRRLRTPAGRLGQAAPGEDTLIFFLFYFLLIYFQDAVITLCLALVSLQLYLGVTSLDKY